MLDTWRRATYSMITAMVIMPVITLASQGGVTDHNKEVSGN